MSLFYPLQIFPNWGSTTKIKHFLLEATLHKMVTRVSSLSADFYQGSLFVCLFWTPYDPGHSSPPGRISHHVSPPPPPPPPPPRYFWHTFCIRFVPSPSSCPVHISYQVSGPSLSCRPVMHIYLNPTAMNPSNSSNPNYELCYFITSNTITTAV